MLRPVGWLRSPRRDVEDDDWGSVVSTIELDPELFTNDALEGLERFSHVEIIFFMHRVRQEKIVAGARHPRDRADLPRVGIFAQRASGRPNQLGLSVAEIVARDGVALTVRGLDAIDGTPILDIKPYMREFSPRSEVRQPAWTAEIMARYW
jgi:tRNA-Thr(GGU) m(6)t(6)A37 methyltransferase TsaA